MPCSSIITWKNGHPKVSPYGHAEAGDHGRDAEPLRGVLHHGLGRDLRDRVALHARRRGGCRRAARLPSGGRARAPGTRRRSCSGRTRRRPGTRSMRCAAPSALAARSRPKSLVLRDREVQHVVEVVGYLVEVAVLEIDADRGDARRPRARSRCAGSAKRARAVHGVVGGERVAAIGPADHAGDAGDEDALAGERWRVPCRLALSGSSAS